MISKKLLAISKNGFQVFVDGESTHALTHFADSPSLEKAASEAITKVELLENIIRTEVELDYFVGNTDLIETTDSDEIVYALRPHRGRYSRFVKNRTTEPSKWIVVDVRKRPDGSYSLYTAFVGRLTPSFPGGDFMPEQSQKFWSNHALVWGTQDIVPGTETSECPW
jgi:hypothetical protein